MSRNTQKRALASKSKRPATGGATRRPVRAGSLKTAIAAGSVAGMLLSTSPASGGESATEVRSVREGFGLSREKFGRLAGCSVRSLANWESGEGEPGEQARVRLVELGRLRESLAGIMHADHVAAWLQTPNPGLDGLKPIEVVERGHIDRLWRMIFEIEAGTPS